MELVRDRYQPMATIGSGGQGEVVRAYDHQHERPVAMKIRVLRSEEERQSLLREAKMLLTMTPHPGLPTVRDDFFVGDRYFIVMEWIDGMTLADVLRDRDGLPVDEVLGYVEQVSGALDHLHAHDPPIVHRDVKPGNIIRTPDGRVVLVDFGLSGPGGSSGIRGGTSGYTAPEMASGDRPTPATDVFGLAATTLALLTGRHPNSEPPDWVGRFGSDAPVIEQAVRRGLSIDPERRQPTASAFVVELAGGRTDRSGTGHGSETAGTAGAGTGGGTGRGARPHRWRRALVAVAAAAAVTVAALTALAALGGPEAPDGPDVPRARAGVGIVVGSLPGDAIDVGSRQGLELVQQRLGVDGTITHASNSVEYQQALLRLARQGFDPVVGITSAYDLGAGVMSRAPDTTFLLSEGDGPSLGPKPPNVSGFVMRTEESGYLAGYLAALVADRERPAPVIGAVLGGDPPEVLRYVAGYRAGARAAVPDVTVLEDSSGSFVDPDRCREVARRQIRRGARVVFVVAGPCSAGAITEATEAGVWAITAVTDEPGPGILTSATKDFAAAISVLVRRAIERPTLSELESVGLADGAVGLGSINPDVPPGIIERVRRVEQDVRAGRISGIPISD
jgi:basic membrane lipoprotein Med (substrate-binding protein (PBP1-ABC) superfamily)/predicted Ser/Thr protein kinase